MTQKRSSDAIAVDRDGSAKRPKQTAELSVEEARLYDRQIRLWGMEAQQRMRNARVLVAGCTGLSNEVVKNIVLAGLGSVTLVDAADVSMRDLGAQFFLREEDVGKNRAECAAARAQLLNPRVKVAAHAANVMDLPEPFFDDFDLICVIDSDPRVISRINSIARARGIGFWASTIVGMRGFIFTDLGNNHTYTPKSTAQSDAQQKPEQKTQVFCDFDAVMEAKFGALKMDRRMRRKMHPLFFAFLVLWKFWIQYERQPDFNDKSDMDDMNAIKVKTMHAAECDQSFLSDELVESIIKTLGRELQPACAVLGGFLSQELLKALSRSDAAVNNFLFYDSWMQSAVCMKAVSHGRA